MKRFTSAKGSRGLESVGCRGGGVVFFGGFFSLGEMFLAGQAMVGVLSYRLAIEG